MGRKSIPEYRLTVPIKSTKMIHIGNWANRPVRGKLITEGRAFDTMAAYRGAHIRAFPKKSYDLSFKESNAFAGAVKLHLNAEYSDPSLMRNKLSLDFFRDIGVLSPEAQHILLYINGLYQGVYLELESVDQRFLKKRGLPEGSIYYAISENANFSKYNPTTRKEKRSVVAGYEIKYDRSNSFRPLREMLQCILDSSEEEFPFLIERYLNVKQYMKWLTGAVCTQNFDGFIHNYALYKNGETERFDILPWDYDATWGRDIHGDVMGNKYVPITGYNTLTARLLLHKAFRKQYKKIMEKALEEAFTVKAIERKVETIYDSIREHLVFDPFKHRALSQFDREPEFILNFVKKRNAYLKQNLISLK